MQQAMHAARVAAAHDALFALLVEQLGEQGNVLDGVTAVFSHEDGHTSMDLTYTVKGLPVAGEGV